MKNFKKEDLKELLRFSHMKEEHVDPTNNDLKDRLLFGRFSNGRFNENDITEYSTKFLSMDIAEKTILASLNNNIHIIDQWMNLCVEKRLVLNSAFINKIGYGFVKNTDFKKGPYDMYNIRIILEADCHFRSFHIVTAYPVPNNATKKKIENDKRDFWNKRK